MHVLFILRKDVEHREKHVTYAPELTLIEGTSLLHQPMACRDG